LSVAQRASSVGTKKPSLGSDDPSRPTGPTHLSTSILRHRWRLWADLEARAAAAAGVALNPKFTIARYQAFPFGDNPTYLAGRKLIVDGMRAAGLPEGDMKTR
jgi:hypothetical protein